MVIFKHIFREHNMLVDGFSKQALKMDLGAGYFTETLDGKVFEHGHFILF